MCDIWEYANECSNNSREIGKCMDRYMKGPLLFHISLRWDNSETDNNNTTNPWLRHPRDRHFSLGVILELLSFPRRHCNLGLASRQAAPPGKEGQWPLTSPEAMVTYNRLSKRWHRTYSPHLLSQYRRQSPPKAITGMTAIKLVNGYILE